MATALKSRFPDLWKTMEQPRDLPIAGCHHTSEQMAEWTQCGACPICLAAHYRVLADKLNHLAVLIAALRTRVVKGELIAEGELQKLYAMATVK